MAKSHKTCMEQAEIIDTFGTYQPSSSTATRSTVTDMVNVSLVIANESVAYMKTCYAYVTF